MSLRCGNNTGSIKLAREEIHWAKLEVSFVIFGNEPHKAAAGNSRNLSTSRSLIFIEDMAACIMSIMLLNDKDYYS